MPSNRHRIFIVFEQQVLNRLVDSSPRRRHFPMTNTEEVRSDKHSNHSEEAGTTGGTIPASRIIGAVSHNERQAA